MDKLLDITQSVEHAAFALDIPTPKLLYAHELSIDNKDETAYYVAGTNEIYFNKTWVNSVTQLEILLTAYIQVRYAYQHFSIINDTNEPFETLETWYHEKTSDIKPDIVFDDEMDLNYISLSYVVDAIAYGHFMLLEHHDTLSHIPDEIKPQVLSRVEVFKARQHIQIT